MEPHKTDGSDLGEQGLTQGRKIAVRVMLKSDDASIKRAERLICHDYEQSNPPCPVPAFRHCGRPTIGKPARETQKPGCGDQNFPMLPPFG